MRCEGAQKRILVMRYRFIGDTILTVPFLRTCVVQSLMPG